MRHYYFILLVFLFHLPCFALSGETLRIIEYPSVEFSTTSRFEISKIELTDTETRITLSWSLQPGSWVTYDDDTWIEDVESKKRYVIKSLADATFAEKILVDDEGKLTNVLIFPPIKKEVKKIDYNNQFYGVSLVETATTTKSAIPAEVEKWIDNELGKVTKEPIKDFESDDFFHRGYGRLVGYIKGYDKRAGFDTGIVYADNELLFEDYPLVVEVHPDGRFEADIPLNHPVSQKMIINDRFINFYLEPEQTVALILDWQDFLKLDQANDHLYPGEKIEYRGKLGRINKEVFSYPKLQFDHQKFYYEYSGKISYKEILNLILDQKKTHNEGLEKLIAANDYLDKSVTILREHSEVQSTLFIIDYLNNLHWLNDAADKNIAEKHIPFSFYKSIQDFPLNKQSMLIDAESGLLLNRFEAFGGVFNAKPKKPEIEYPLQDYLEEHGVELSQEERNILGSKTFTNKEEQDLYFKKWEVFKEKYKDLIEAYNKENNVSTLELSLQEYLEENGVEFSEENKNLFEQQFFENDEAFKLHQEKLQPYLEKYKDLIKAYNDEYIIPYLQQEKKREKENLQARQQRGNTIKNSLFNDIKKTRKLKWVLSQKSNAKEAYVYWDEVKGTIKSDFVREEGQRYIDSKLQKSNVSQIPDMTTSGFKIKSEAIVLPDGKAKELFYNIADKYKGKIVFIDFWATWCGPCISNIKSMKEIRAEYKGNPDFEFVFITGEDSPEDRYNTFIEEQELENTYRVDTNTYNRFRQLFNFNGIPRYIVLDKNGDVINGNFDIHNFTKLLPGILEQYK